MNDYECEVLGDYAGITRVLEMQLKAYNLSFLTRTIIVQIHSSLSIKPSLGTSIMLYELHDNSFNC